MRSGGAEISEPESQDAQDLELPEEAKPLPTCAKCGEPLVLKPVPGAKRFPLRLECAVHGWQEENFRPIRMRFHKDAPNW
jgi:hypothetical protein